MSNDEWKKRNLKRFLVLINKKTGLHLAVQDYLKQNQTSRNALIISALQRFLIDEGCDLSLYRDIGQYIMDQTDDNEIDNISSLCAFFTMRGLQVIDKRPNGGCLWIVGEREDIEEIVNQAIQRFRVSGTYASGKATKQRSGWYTDSLL